MTRAKANISGTYRVWNRTDERELWRKNVKRNENTDLPLGDGKAQVSQTRGFKHWYSTREAGLTVEATVSVSIACGQSEREIDAAIEEAGRIAEKHAIVGAEEMDLHLDSFVKDTRR